MRPTTIKLIIYIAFTIWVCSCSPGKSITGPITDVSGREVECKGKRFVLLNAAPIPSKGKKATFIPVRKNDKRINAKIINP